MKGKIKTYNKDRGFGFIIGSDEKEYFFHISEVESADDIHRGLSVEFLPSSGSKGLVANEVNIIPGLKKPIRFVSFGDLRLKASNIKDYGIDSKVVEVYVDYRVKEFEPIARALLTPLYRIVKKIDPSTNIDPSFKQYVTKKEYQNKKYLYVTTYQNDYYVFWEHEASFDVVAKYEELDSLFSLK